MKAATKTSEQKTRSAATPGVQPLPKVRQAHSRAVAVAVLLVLTVLAAILFGPGQTVATSQASSAPLTWTQNQPASAPTSVVPPTCPLLRPDPTFGVSLIDVQTGQPLCERNADGIAQPASTTKVMSALLVEEYLQAHNLSLDTSVIALKIDKQVEWDASVAYLQVGQKYSVRLLLSMVSIISAADATMALARFVAGSRANFLAQMNQQAQALGMLHTHYTSPYGYARTSPDDWQDGEAESVGNYSSAHDMALLMRAFARYPDLVIIFGATEYHEGAAWLYRSPVHSLPDSWVGLQAPDDPSATAVKNLHLPFQVLAQKKGCMWCDQSLHKISYVLLVRFQQQTVAAAFLYTTQNYFNPLVGDMLPTLLWAFHQCDVPAYSRYCNPPPPTPTPSPMPAP
ncbi:MAG TPA: serine hydrolase [Ktedonobacterales bacterium]